jgi:hypothetical protein
LEHRANSPPLLSPLPVRSHLHFETARFDFASRQPPPETVCLSNTWGRSSICQVTVDPGPPQAGMPAPTPAPQIPHLLAQKPTLKLPKGTPTLQSDRSLGSRPTQQRQTARNWKIRPALTNRLFPTRRTSPTEDISHHATRPHPFSCRGNTSHKSLQQLALQHAATAQPIHKTERCGAKSIQ